MQVTRLAAVESVGAEERGSAAGSSAQLLAAAAPRRADAAVLGGGIGGGLGGGGLGQQDQGRACCQLLQHRVTCAKRWVGQAQMRQRGR